MASAVTKRQWRSTLSPYQPTLTQVEKFGIDTANMFGFWDWVGGRYSMDSAIGLATMLAIGPDNFRAMLDGFHQMDEHFRTTPFERNLPVLLGLLGLWYADFFGAQTVAVLPYEQYLKRFPAYLQQLTMESNGKHVHYCRQRVQVTTQAPFIGASRARTVSIPSINSFIRGPGSFPATLSRSANRSILSAVITTCCWPTCLRRAEALAFGKTLEQVKAEGTPDWLAPHRVFEGNRPSNTILADRLTPEVLGKLIALYEHAVFTQGIIWQINSFDQWGVELGKVLAQRIIPELESDTDPNLAHDSSTNNLIQKYRKLKKQA